DGKVVDKLPRPFAGFLQVDAEHYQTSGVVLVVSGNQTGRLLPAGQAPAGPEINEQSMTLEVAQPHLLAVDILEEEIRRCPANLGRGRLSGRVLSRRQIDDAESTVVAARGASLKVEESADDNREESEG